MARGQARRTAADLFWRGMTVFFGALLVNTSAGDYITRLKTLAFWQEVAAAAGTAVASQVITYVAIRLGRHERAATGCDKVGPNSGGGGGG